ncbi:odorant receptor 4-like [Achroia grisella]|uniref:odorant receptor 4-like n=1 Tax=Achroia grisella TaxID=688607 RepID=UPI0027D34D9B|nr:odorant receptor 4-like [Achroia grisella]
MASFLKKYILRQSKPIKEENTEDKIYNLNDFDETLAIIKKVLWIVGLRLTRKDSDNARYWFSLFYWFETANVLMAFSLQTMETIEDTRGATTFEDATTLFRMIPCIGFLPLAILKSYKILCYESVYENLIAELRSMWPQGKVTEDEHNVIRKALRQLQIVLKGYYWCNYGLVISCVAPCYITIIKNIFGKNEPGVLPFLWWVPFDPLQHIVFELIVLIQTWHAILVMSFILSGDLLYFFFISHITTQFDLLSIRINRFILVPTDEQLINTYPLGIHYKTFKNDHTLLEVAEVQNTKINTAVHEKEIFNIILRHRTLIRLCGDVESIFSFSLLISFLNSSVIICFSNFCCVVIEKWYEFMYKSFLITTLCQTWLICWYGQKLLDSGEKLSQALYNCGWYLASQKIKRTIHIMIHRSQKEVCVTTYGFTKICLASYTAIIKTSWSYFTLLVNTYKQ